MRLVLGTVSILVCALASTAAAQTSYPLHGTASLRGCSGALFKYEGQPDTAKALILTNGHCLTTREPALEVKFNEPDSRPVTFFDADDNETRSYQTTRLVYWTMYGTDFAILELDETYADIKAESNVTPMLLSPTRPNVGDNMAVVSGFHEYVTECQIDAFIFGMEESRWIWEDSIRYTQDCVTFGGTSGSPIVNTDTGYVIGVNNTGYEGGAACSINNPCEVDEQGNKTTIPDGSYGQQTFWTYSCLTDDFELDLGKPGCLLPAFGDLNVTNTSLTATMECDDDGTLDAGETATLSITISNPGLKTLEDTAVTLSTSSSILSFPDGNNVVVPQILAGGETTIDVTVTLADDVDGIETVVVNVEASNELSSNPSVTGTAFAKVNLDETLASSTFDDVEAASTVWDATADITSEQWSRAADDSNNTVWYGVDIAQSGDQRLESPTLEVGSDPFTVSLVHRFSFETSQNTFWDGGVIEISTNGGSTWNDAADFIDGGYPGTLTDNPANPLANRPAFVGASDGYPGTTTLNLDFGTELAGESVKLRFRLGTDGAAGDFGWEIDDIDVQGITNTPFASVEADSCGGDGGGDGDGDGDTGGDGDGDGDTTGGDGDGDTTTTGGDGDGDTTGTPGGDPPRRDDGGCAVGAGGSLAAGWPLALGLLFVARRRRRG